MLEAHAEYLEGKSQRLPIAPPPVEISGPSKARWWQQEITVPSPGHPGKGGEVAGRTRALASGPLGKEAGVETGRARGRCSPGHRCGHREAAAGSFPGV